MKESSIIVVKAGGAKGINSEAVCTDIAALVQRGLQPILVHGGSHETNRYAERLGHPPRFVTSVSGHTSRYTDRTTLEIFVMVAAGRINKLLVEQLQQRGVNALGLSGPDGRLLEGKRKDTLRIVEGSKRKVLRGEYSGIIEKVNGSLLSQLLSVGLVPVVAPLAISYDHEILNVDGDRASAAIASALGAHTLVILSNVPGLLRDVTDESSHLQHIPLAQAQRYLDQYAQGRMKRKMLGAIEALQAGVGQVILADGRCDQPVRQALAGKGTIIR
jgi:acetylglutamate/LysW-gamma-L-alpha-aminoadipate kinase